MYVDLGTGVRRSKDVPRIAYVLKSALVPDLITRTCLVTIVQHPTCVDKITN